MVEDYKKYYYGRTDMTMLNDEKVYGSLGINLKEVTTIVEGHGSVVLHNSLKKPFRKFELLGNSTQGENPAPDNPQEIKSAGRKSKNLFNISDLKNGQVQSDGTIKAVGVYKSIVLNIKEDGKYFITFKKNDEYDVLYFTTLYSSEIFSNPYINIYPDAKGTILLKKGRNILSFKAKKNGAECPFINDYEIMIAAESETTDYEPYGYLLDVKVTGKNLLDKSIILPLSSYDIKDGIYWRKYFYLLPNTDYLIRVTPHYTEKLVDTSGFLGVGEPYDNNLPNGIISLIPDVGTTDKTNYFRTDATGKVILKFKDSANEENIRKMLEQVEITLALKTFNNEHEPYTEQTVQIALDEPLRGIGDYKDVLTKDGVVRKIAPYEVNLNDLRDGGYSKTNTVMFSVKVQNKTVGYASSKPSILCNILPDCALQMSNIYNNDKECIAVGGGIVLFRVNKSRLKDMSSFEATKQSFIELMADKKMIVEYAIETPVTEPLPESVQQQLQALHSENGTTHVFVDSGEVEAGINIEYVVGA